MDREFTEPIVSVLMTSYNRELFIEESIKSVLNSSFKNFELIIVDDCSTDKTQEIARKYELIDKRVKLYINENNIGDYPKSNVALSYASGFYIKYLDSDDLLYSYSLEIMVNQMKHNPTAAIGLLSNNINSFKPFPNLYKSNEILKIHFFKNGILNCGPSGVIIKKDVLFSIGKFSGKRMVGDIEAWLKIAFEYDVLILPPSLIFWRQHDNQEYKSGIDDNIYLELNYPLIEELFNLKTCPLSEYNKSIILNYYKKINARSILKLILIERKFTKAIYLHKILKLSFSNYINTLFSPINSLENI